MTDRLSSSRPAAVGQEPRRHPRFGPNRKVALSCTEGVPSVFGWGNWLPAPTLLDLSPTGLKLSTPEALQTGSVLRVVIATDGLPNDVEIFGEVRWSEPNGKNPADFSAWIEFFGIAAQKIGDLKDLCEHLKKTP